jgi:hypothetical protein
MGDLFDVVARGDLTSSHVVTGMPGKSPVRLGVALASCLEAAGMGVILEHDPLRDGPEFRNHLERDTSEITWGSEPNMITVRPVCAVRANQ